jgi:hypothetical protein
LVGDDESWYRWIIKKGWAGMTEKRLVGRMRGTLAALTLAGAMVVPVTLALTPAAASASPLPPPCQRAGLIGETLVQVESTVDQAAVSVGDNTSGLWSGVNGVYATANAVACLVGVGL